MGYFEVWQKLLIMTYMLSLFAVAVIFFAAISAIGDESELDSE